MHVAARNAMEYLQAGATDDSGGGAAGFKEMVREPAVAGHISDWARCRSLSEPEKMPR